jgi:hypothetical protein
MKFVKELVHGGNREHVAHCLGIQGSVVDAKVLQNWAEAMQLVHVEDHVVDLDWNDKEDQYKLLIVDEDVDCAADSLASDVITISCCDIQTGHDMGCMFKQSTVDIEMNELVELKSIKALMVALAAMFQWGRFP